VAPEIMVRPVGSYADIHEPDAQSLVIGPGLGEVQPVSAESLRRLACEFEGTVVLDADGLNTAAANRWQAQPNWVLTPHPGEMRRLDPRPATTRRETVARYLEQHDCVLLLKGARTIVADRTGTLYNSTGGPYMANGGQGDVLAGTIGALAAQGLSPFRAAATGALACGMAAEAAWSAAGYPHAIRATDVIRHLPVALSR
jgi:NAD(P)H-hydrate epimerase